MNKEELIAKLVLQELRRKKRLNKIVHRPGYQYYLQGAVIGILAGVVGTGIALQVLLRDAIYLWIFSGLSLAVIALLETIRQKEQISARAKLSEMERGELEKSSL